MTLSPPPFTLSDFDFELPDELIAQHPAAERSASRLLDATATPPIDRTFRELPSLLRPGDLLVVNDTRVIRARLFGTKASGGAVQALVERVLPGNEVLAHLRASKSPRPGTWVRFADAFDAEVLGRGGDRVEAQPLASPASSSPRASPTSTGAAAPTRSVAGPGDMGCRGEQPVAGTAAAASLFRLRFPADPFALLERHGHVPLPPYIRHADDAQDVERYQTVFAARPGAVAAPTAALHFDDALIKTLLAGGVRLASITLHVGGGTFQPVRTESLAEHTMHREWFEVSLDTVQAITATRAAGGRVVAVGTTSLRALESAASAPTEGRSDGLQPFSGETDIFITPGFEFRVADLLVTNFHLPKSTLMMLVSAFAGHGRVMALYRHAVAARYRFFSYGDAMLLAREPAARRAG